MSFEDLPQDWTAVPLTSPRVAGAVVDRVLSEKLRAEDTLLLISCDERGVAYPPPILISETDWQADGQERREMLEVLAALGVPSIVVAFSSSRPVPSGVVDAWHADVDAAFAAAGTRLLGVFTAWSHTVRSVSQVPVGT